VALVLNPLSIFVHSYVIMGVRLTWGYAPWLVAVFMGAAALFALRVYRTPVRFGWI